MTIGVGDEFPKFNLKAVDGKKFDDITVDNVFIDVNENIHKNKWMTIFFFPKAFSFVCPTEISAFADMKEEFDQRNCLLVTASTDNEYTHWAWRRNEEYLRDLPIMMIADIKRELSESLGIIDKNQGVAQRATFIIDPDGIVRFSMVTDLNIGRNPNEVLRVLDALQTNEPCPCNWNKGDSTIDVHKAADRLKLINQMIKHQEK